MQTRPGRFRHNRTKISQLLKPSPKAKHSSFLILKKKKKKEDLRPLVLEGSIILGVRFDAITMNYTFPWPRRRINLETSVVAFGLLK